MSGKGDRGALSAKAQESLGMIPGSKFFSPYPFAGMNVQASGIAMDDKEFRYNENFFRLGDGKLRTAWDVGSALYSVVGAPTIIHFFSYNIGPVYYFAVFLSDGTGYQVNASTGAVTTISATPSLFYNSSSGYVPATTQWGILYLIISNKNTPNDYWIWDGALFYPPGSLAPGLIELLATGTNYSSVPTVTAFGGSGSGATFDVTINDGGVVQIQITNPGSGYEVGDIPQLAFSGGGSDTSAQLAAFLTDGSVVAVSITSAGSSYVTAPTVSFTGGGGTGAAATAFISGGVSSISVTGGGGSGYTSPPTVTLTGGGGSGATATAVLSGTSVASLTVVTPGSGYTSAPTVVLAGGGGTGAGGTAHINQGVTSVIVTAGGSGYSSAPAVVFSSGAASAVALLTSSSVIGVTVVNGGTGFLYAPQITFVGGGGTGAAGTVVLNGTSIATVNVINGGAGYAAAPTISFVGGGGTGATATATVAGGSVVNITVTNGGSGYTTNPEVVITPAVGDHGTGATATAIFAATSIGSVQMSNYGLGYTSAPTVIITPGANNAAYASLNLMPFGISGSAVETFQSRVWISDPAPAQFNNLPQGGNFAVSAPESLTDFATSDGGVLFTNSDSFLQTHYVNIRQTNGYLYFFGDGSVSVVSNVQTTGNPSTTTFNYQNVDPQIGMSWRDSRQDFSRTILFGNETGVYGLYGGACTKISGNMDDIFVNAIFPPTSGALTPTGAVATVFNVKHYFMLMTIKDPDTQAYRNVMVTWNEKEWNISSQGVALTIIGSQKIESNLYAWGTDGKSLYPMFNTQSATLEKRLDTKLYGASSLYMLKGLKGIYLQASDLSENQAGIAFNVEVVSGGIATQNPDYITVPSLATFEGFLQPPNFQAGSSTGAFPCMTTGSTGIPFITLGLDLTTKSPDFVLGNLAILYTDDAAFLG